ncbi:MAG: ribosomal protein S18-alanine N-acetyltransferase [candidate division Zixibacteria bacterium]|nr:ribosomal protein S18-alanine N-acetyltransferase [candidate division Zixibacteria bacterium]
MRCELRPATPGDVPAINAIERGAFPCPWPEYAFYRELENDLSTLKVLTVDGEVVGYYDLWVCANEAHLLNVAVADRERRRGYGTKLMEDVIAEAKHSRCVRIVLEVRPGNEAAIKIYEKLGFKKVTHRLRYYSDGEDADVMVKSLREP